MGNMIGIGLPGSFYSYCILALFLASPFWGSHLSPVTFGTGAALQAQEDDDSVLLQSPSEVSSPQEPRPEKGLDKSGYFRIIKVSTMTACIPLSST